MSSRTSLILSATKHKKNTIWATVPQSSSTSERIARLNDLMFLLSPFTTGISVFDIIAAFKIGWKSSEHGVSGENMYQTNA